MGCLDLITTQNLPPLLFWYIPLLAHVEPYTPSTFRVTFNHDRIVSTPINSIHWASGSVYIQLVPVSTKQTLTVCIFYNPLRMLHNGLEMNCQQPILKFLTSLVPRHSVIITERLGTRLVLNLLQILCACTVSSDYGQWRRSLACVSPETLTLLLYCLSLGMAASSDYGQWRSTLACVSPETLTLLLYCLSLGMAAGTDHGQWRRSLACVPPETLCSYGSSTVLPIPWGVWDGCRYRSRPMEELPRLCLSRNYVLVRVFYCIAYPLGSVGWLPVQITPNGRAPLLVSLQKLCARTALLLHCLSPGKCGMAARVDYGHWRSTLTCVPFH